MKRAFTVAKLKKRTVIICCFIISTAISALFLCGCGGKELNLYEAGIGVTSTMETLLKDETYVDLVFGETADVEDYIASDYDSPIKVYSISKHDADKVEKLLVNGKPGLSDAGKEQIRFYAESFEYVLSLIKQNNVRHDIVSWGFSCPKVYENRSLKEETAYLYVFETGKPILVRFSEINGDVYAYGYFFTVDTTLSSLRDLFEPYGSKVEIIKGEFQQ